MHLSVGDDFIENFHDEDLVVEKSLSVERIGRRNAAERRNQLVEASEKVKRHNRGTASVPTGRHHVNVIAGNEVTGSSVDREPRLRMDE